MAANYYKFNTNDCLSERFDEDIVVINFSTCHYTNLNKGASIIFDHLCDAVSMHELRALLLQQEPTLADSFSVLVERLEMAAILLPIDTGKSAVGVSLPLDLGRLEVDVFDDMADLLKADPIHDFDATVGWPVKHA